MKIASQVTFFELFYRSKKLPYPEPKWSRSLNLGAGAAKFWHGSASLNSNHDASANKDYGNIPSLLDIDPELPYYHEQF